MGNIYECTASVYMQDGEKAFTIGKRYVNKDYSNILLLDDKGRAHLVSGSLNGNFKLISV